MTSLSILEVTAQIAVVTFMLRGRFIVRWPSIFVSTASNLATYIVLLALMNKPHFYAVYFYAYWASSAFQSLVRLWMLADILRSIPVFSFVPNSVAVLLSGASISLAAFSWRLTLADGIRFSGHIVASATLLSRCIDYACAGLVFGLIGAVWILRFGWDRHVAYVTYGVTASIFCQALVTTFLSLGGFTLRVFANGFESVSDLIILTWWSACFFYGENFLKPNDPSLSPAKAQLLDRLLTLVQLRATPESKQQ